MSESKLPCPAEDYKDVECPSKRKELLKMMRKVHPDKNPGCPDLAESVTKRLNQDCPYDDDGNLDREIIMIRQMEQAFADAQSSASRAQAQSRSAAMARSVNARSTYLNSKSNSREEETLKDTMNVFKELIEEPVRIQYPYPDLPKEIEEVFPGEEDPQHGMDKNKIRANKEAELGAAGAKNSQIASLAQQVRRAHEALKASNPQLAGRSVSMSGRRRWVRKTPTSGKNYFASDWAKGVLRRHGHASHTDRNSGPWYSGGKKKTKKAKKAKKAKKKKTAKKSKKSPKKRKKKTHKKAYGKKNVWIKFGEDMECNHKLRRCRKVKFSPIVKSATKKSATKKSTKKSATKKSATKKEKKTYTTIFSKKSKTKKKKSIFSK